MRVSLHVFQIRIDRQHVWLMTGKLQSSEWGSFTRAKNNQVRSGQTAETAAWVRANTTGSFLQWVKNERLCVASNDTLKQRGTPELNQIKTCCIYSVMTHRTLRMRCVLTDMLARLSALVFTHSVHCWFRNRALIWRCEPGASTDHFTFVSIEVLLTTKYLFIYTMTGYDIRK